MSHSPQHTDRSTMPADLAAAIDQLREHLGVDQLAHLGQLLADEQYDRWAEQAPGTHGPFYARDGLARLRKTVQVRRTDLESLLRWLPSQALEQLLEPRPSWQFDESTRIARDCEAEFRTAVRSGIVVYGQFVQGDIGAGEDLLDKLCVLIRVYPFTSRRDYDEAAHGVRAAYSALEQGLRHAACDRVVRATEELFDRRATV